MLLELTAATQRLMPLTVSAPHARLAAPPRLAEQVSDETRRDRLKQLFGGDFRDELSRSSPVKQDRPRKAPEDPKWKTMENATPDRAWRAERYTLWLQDRGVKMDKVEVVEASDDRRLALITAEDVPAGTVLFDVPDTALLTADAALADPGVGRSLRILASKQPGPGFDTFAIATLLAAERVRRGAVAGKLRRREGGLDEVMTAKLEKRVLPEWSSDEAATLQSNGDFGPYVASLAWAEAGEECVVDVEQAEAFSQGSRLIETMIEPTARNAWTQSAGQSGLLAPPTSTEDCGGTALQALLLATELQLEAPPPLGDADGEARWGGNVDDPLAPALCPLAELVLLPAAGGALEGARAAGALNAALGRPSSGRVESALRCVATRDLPAGSVVLSDVPGGGVVPPSASFSSSSSSGAGAGAAAAAAAGDRVRIVGGPLAGQLGLVLRLRNEDQRPIVRLDGEAKKLVVLAAEKLEVLEPAV